MQITLNNPGNSNVSSGLSKLPQDLKRFGSVGLVLVANAVTPASGALPDQQAQIRQQTTPVNAVTGVHRASEKVAPYFPEVIETDLSFTEPLKQREETGLIVLHHTGLPNDPGNKPIEDIHVSEQEFSGFSGIGYHYYIPKDGDIYRGRPEGTVGAHAYNSKTGENFNTRSIGIALGGNFEYSSPTPSQIDSLNSLLLNQRIKHPNAQIVGHGKIDGTLCPGENFPIEQFR